MHDLDFKLRPSRQYLIFFSVILLISVGMMLALPIAFWMQCVGVAIIVAYGVTILWRVVLLRSQHSITRIRRTTEGRWFLSMHDQVLEASLRGDSTVTNFVSVLRFDTPKQRWPLACVLFRDSLDAHRYRELLVALRVLPRA